MINFLNTLGDIITISVFRIGVPLLLALIIFKRQRNFWPIIVYAVANAGLDFFWQWYKSPLDCPLWKVCYPTPVMQAISYNGLWVMLFGIPAAVGLILLAVIARGVRRIAEKG